MYKKELPDDQALVRIPPLTTEGSAEILALRMAMTQGLAFAFPAPDVRS
jgi:hypothetical protein